jgi:hypothetical protein
VQVDLATHERRELVLQAHQRESWNVPRLELDEDVDVAVRAEVVPENRAKESESPDMMAATEIGQALSTR